MRQKSYVPLTDTLRLPDSVQSQAGALLSFVQAQTERVVEFLWPHLDTIGATDHQAWKAIITLAQTGDLPLCSPDLYIPDRVWRCILESAGRILRQHADRKRVLELLLPVLTAETLADDQALQAAVFRLAEGIKEAGGYEKRGYLLNLAEQVLAFYGDNERLPTDYFELQPVPSFRSPFLTLAADDGGEKGQVYRLEVVEGTTLRFRFKYPLTPDSQSKRDWAWTDEVEIALPPPLMRRLDNQAVPQAPNVRLMTTRRGQSVAVLDYITENPVKPEPSSGNVLAYDWDVRRLATIVILDGEGNQLTPPIFLNTGGLEGKQARLRTQIDHLRAKRDKLAKDHPDRAKVQAEIDHGWRKYEARNKTIAHFASTVIICLAVLYECDTIAGEWLKTLRVRKAKNGRGKKARFRNWRISTTVREAVAGKVKYKATLLGKKHLTVWPRGTSHACPRCGEPGITTHSPEHTANIRWGAWFKCKCGFNGDRDYIAAVNIGRRGLWGRQKISNPASYIGAGAALLFPSQLAGKFARKRSTTLSGLSQVVQLRPRYALLC